MKKLVTKLCYAFPAFVLLMFFALAAKAQYTGTNLETGGLYTAMIKDGSNNLYVTRVKPATGGATYEVEKYTNGTGTPAVIYASLKHEVTDFPWGLAVTSTGNVFISSDFSSASGQIIKLTLSGGTYTSSVYQNGRYFSSLAVDASDNLYATEYDAANLTYAVVKYPANSAKNTAGTKLYDALKAGAGYGYPTGMAVAPNGDVYVNDAFSVSPSLSDGGRIYKLTAASSYAVSTISSGNYSSALALDASGNLFTTENRGSGYALIEYANATGAGVPVFTGLHTNGIYYPWGIAISSGLNLYVADGDDGSGGAVIHLTPSPPTVITTAITAGTPTSATLNGQVNDNGNTTTVNFIYGISATLSGATTTPATTGGTISAGTGLTPVALNVSGLTPSTTYHFAVSATNSGGTVQGAILAFTTTPTVSYTTPKVYTAAVPIPNLAPTHSNLPAPAYGSNRIIGSGFLTPFGVNSDAAGNIYVADYGNKAIKKIPAGGGAPITLLSGLNVPLGVAVDAAGTIFVADAGNTTINKYLAGTTTPIAVSTGFTSPYGVAVDAAGNVFVADYGASAVKKIPAGGGSAIAIGTGFTSPTGVAVDASGNVFVADYGNGLVKEIPASGGATVSVGSGFTSPVGVDVDPSGNVFVGDYGASAVFEIPAGGGSPISIGAGFNHCTGVSVDGYGVLSVADYLGNDIQVVAPTGGFYISKFLPKGLAFNQTSGIINGTPVLISPATNYTVTAWNKGGGNSTVVNIKVVANPALSVLTISAGALSPAFASATLSYSASVTSDVTTTTVTPTTVDPAATVTVNGMAVASGSPSTAIALSAGDNVIKVIVTGQDGTTKRTYTITVTRAASTDANLTAIGPSVTPLSPVFFSSHTSYTLSVPYSKTSITVKPVTENAGATLKVNGTSLASGTTSAPINLAPGAITNVNIVVTAEDGVTTKTYTVAVTRGPSTDATLSAMGPQYGPLTPVFSPTTTSYTLSVANSKATMTVTPVTTDANATIKVNGTTVASGATSAAIPLAEGAMTAINVVVTAQDGSTTKTYTVNVTRAPSSDASLSAMNPQYGPLSPVFNTNTTSYTLNVANSKTSMTVAPVTTDGNATMMVNGTPLASGVTSSPIALAVGQTTITVAVKAQDGSTTKTYTITVTRASGGADAYDPGLSVNKPEDKPSFEDDILLVHQGISPNGDGIDDYLVIDGIQAYPDNRLAIMNRNGQLIYEAKGYDNSSKMFDGHSNKNGKMQLPGTYFYQLDYTVNGIVKHKTGFLLLKY